MYISKTRLVEDVKIASEYSQSILLSWTKMYFYFIQLELGQKSTNLSEYHAKHTKCIVVTGYKRVHLKNKASWRCENCVRILAKYSAFLDKDDFYFIQLELGEKSTNLSEYHAKHTKCIVVTGYKRVHLKNKASWRCENCVRILAKYSAFLDKDVFYFIQLELGQKSTNLSEYHAKHTKYIVVTGYKRVHLKNKASWRCENCVRILAKYSAFLDKDDFYFIQLELGQKSTNLSEYHAKHTKCIVVTGYKCVHLNNEAG